jgi:glyoxylase-like metal-dependent hydrolase (beta-lactamase superfamily II)
MVDEPTPLPPIIPGVARALSPLLRRIASGTEADPGLNTYLVGIDEIVIVDPGPDDPAHLDIIVGCGGDRIRWITMTDTDPANSAGAERLKEMTGAEIIAPAGFPGADESLGDGYKIDATEFRITAIALTEQHHCFVVEQERTLLTGEHLVAGVPDGLRETVRSYRLKAIAPGHGQYIDNAKSVLG